MSLKEEQKMKYDIISFFVLNIGLEINVLLKELGMKHHGVKLHKGFPLMIFNLFSETFSIIIKGNHSGFNIIQTTNNNNLTIFFQIIKDIALFSDLTNC